MYNEIGLDGASLLNLAGVCASVILGFIFGQWAFGRALQKKGVIVDVEYPSELEISVDNQIMQNRMLFQSEAPMFIGPISTLEYKAIIQEDSGLIKYDVPLQLRDDIKQMKGKRINFICRCGWLGKRIISISAMTDKVITDTFTEHAVNV